MDRRGTHRKISIDKNRERRDRKRQTDTVQCITKSKKERHNNRLQKRNQETKRKNK